MAFGLDKSLGAYQRRQMLLGWVYASGELPSGAVLSNHETVWGEWPYHVFSFKNVHQGYEVDGDRCAARVYEGGGITVTVSSWHESLPVQLPTIPFMRPQADAVAVLVDPANQLYTWREKPTGLHPCWRYSNPYGIIFRSMVTGRVIAEVIEPVDANAFSYSGSDGCPPSTPINDVWGAWRALAHEHFTKWTSGHATTKSTLLGSGVSIIYAAAGDARHKFWFAQAHGGWQAFTLCDVDGCGPVMCAAPCVDAPGLSVDEAIKESTRARGFDLALCMHCGAGANVTDPASWSVVMRQGYHESVVVCYCSPGNCPGCTVCCAWLWFLPLFFENLTEGRMTYQGAFIDAIAQLEPGAQSCFTFVGPPWFFGPPPINVRYIDMSAPVSAAPGTACAVGLRFHNTGYDSQTITVSVHAVNEAHGYDEQLDCVVGGCNITLTPDEFGWHRNQLLQMPDFDVTIRAEVRYWDGVAQRWAGDYEDLGTIAVTAPLCHLTMAVDGSGWTVPPSPGVYECYDGQVVVLSAVPMSDWSFSYWTGTDNNSINPTTVTMDSDKTVTAYFVEDIVYYDLTTDVVGSGSVSPSSGTYEEGTVVTLTATPGTGWEFSYWTGTNDNSVNPTTVTMNSDKHVGAYFTRIVDLTGVGAVYF